MKSSQQRTNTLSETIPDQLELLVLEILTAVSDNESTGPERKWIWLHGVQLFHNHCKTVTTRDSGTVVLTCRSRIVCWTRQASATTATTTSAAEPPCRHATGMQTCSTASSVGRILSASPSHTDTARYCNTGRVQSHKTWGRERLALCLATLSTNNRSPESPDYTAIESGIE